MAYKVFTNGSVLQASEVNDNLMNQAVITFTNSAARTSAITSPVEGMVTYLADTDTYQFWNGSAWTNLITRPPFVGFHAISSGLTTTTSSWTKVAYSTEVYDTSGFHDNVTNNTRITIPAGLGGFYQFAGYIDWASNGSGVRAAEIYKNNASFLSLIQYPAIAGALMRPSFFGIGQFAAGDYAELTAIQTSGGNLAVGSSLTVTYLGA